MSISWPVGRSTGHLDHGRSLSGYGRTRDRWDGLLMKKIMKSSTPDMLGKPLVLGDWYSPRYSVNFSWYTLHHFCGVWFWVILRGGGGALPQSFPTLSKVSPNLLNRLTSCFTDLSSLTPRLPSWTWNWQPMWHARIDDGIDAARETGSSCRDVSNRLQPVLIEQLLAVRAWIISVQSPGWVLRLTHDCQWRSDDCIYFQVRERDCCVNDDILFSFSWVDTLYVIRDLWERPIQKRARKGFMALRQRINRRIRCQNLDEECAHWSGIGPVGCARFAGQRATFCLKLDLRHTPTVDWAGCEQWRCRPKAWAIQNLIVEGAWSGACNAVACREIGTQ
jgi:hypothetical protein